jgi:hypothetical protein
MRAGCTVIVMVVLSLSQWGCPGATPPNARQAWQRVIQPCVGGDVLSKRVIYLGPSNNVGPGSMWRQKADGSYALVWTSDKLPNFQGNVINKGNDVVCVGEGSHKFNGRIAGTLLTSALAGVSADASAELSKASSVTVQVQFARVEQLMEGPFNAWWQNNQDEPFAKDAVRDGRLLMTTAYLVKGMTATLTYQSGGAARAAAAFQSPTTAATVGNVKANLEVTSSDDNTLQITAPDEFYVLGGVGRYDPDSATIAAGGKVIQPQGRPKTKGGLDVLAIEPRE